MFGRLHILQFIILYTENTEAFDMYDSIHEK